MFRAIPTFPLSSGLIPSARHVGFASASLANLRLGHPLLRSTLGPRFRFVHVAIGFVCSLLSFIYSCTSFAVR
jgi:hypothetical protein